MDTAGQTAPHAGRKRIARIALGDILHRSARRFGDRVAIISGTRRVSFAALDRDSNRFAHALLATGLPAGARVGMLCGNSVAMVCAFIGIQKAGLVWVPINVGLSAAAIEHVAAHAEITHLVIDGELFARPDLQALTAGAAIGCTVIDPTAGFTAEPRAIDYAAFVADRPDTLPEVDIGSDDLALIMYTSGTTGRQKGVMHSHASVHAALMSNVVEFGATQDDVASGFFPLFHVSQHTVAMSFWLVGAALDLQRGFDLDRLLTAIGTSRITFLVALPAMYGAMLDHPRLRMFDLSSLRLCIYAMAPMPQPMLRRLIETICPRFALCSGQTEMYSITTMFKPEQQLRRAGPYWGDSAAVCETAIMDDAGRLLGPGGLGEIVHRGPNAMLGYYKDPDATAEAQRFGWHHTGDLGLLDADGQLLFVDRKKDIIKTGGENVPSLKVEEALLRHAAVANAAAIGLPHPRWGEAVTAFVLLRPGCTPPSSEAFEAHCRDILGRFEVPKRVVILDEFPMTTTGKIQKALLRQQYQDLHRA